MTDPTSKSLIIEREFPHPPEKIWRALTQNQLIEQWLMSNDFEPGVRAAYPTVDETLSALADAGAPGRAMLSGSGGACFALFAQEGAARACAARVRTPADTALHVVPFATSQVWRTAAG